jgi:very-short-patch-repair endonuclease/predicted transcriptional regulator of viral defense system
MPGEGANDHDIDAECPPRRWDREVADLAERQHGVVARRQLAQLGLGRGGVEHRLGTGRLHVVHPGVYAVGHRVMSREGHWMAAVLAAGHGAVLSHRSAAALWGIRESARGAVEVTAAHWVRRGPAVEAHRSGLPGDERTRASGIPVTTVSRTLLDLAAVLPRESVARAIREAEVRRLTDAVSLAALADRYPGRRGVATVRSIMTDAEIGSMVTRSELEDRFVDFLRSTGLPRPEINMSLQVAGTWVEVDCLWRAQRLIVELDGQAFHATLEAFERDRFRDRALGAAGWRVVRVTWRQLHDDPISLAADLGSLLAVR